MTTQENKRFAKLDETVRQVATGVVEAARALVEIRNLQLYRAKHKTFEAYCRDVHNMSRAYAYNVMRSGITALEMSSIEDKFKGTSIPTRETHLRELAKIEDNQQRFEVLAEVIDEVGPTFTAKDLSAKVNAKIAAGAGDEVKPKKVNPTQRLETVKEDFAQLSAALNQFDYGPEVQSLVKRLAKTLED